MNEGHRLSTGSFGLGRYTALIQLRYGLDTEEIRRSQGERWALLRPMIKAGSYHLPISFTSYTLNMAG
jgi:hypothetical protein